MNTPEKREQLEMELEKAIREGEAEAFRDPEVKSMIESLRTMYTSDKGSLFSALGLSAPQPSNPDIERVSLPDSKIPDLIFMLDRLAKQSGRPEWKKALEANRSRKPVRPGAIHPSRKPSLPSHTENPVEVLDVDGVSGTQNSPLTGEKAIRVIEEQIRQHESMLELIQRDADKIRRREGTYAIPMNRLKAERLLREIPGKISMLREKKIELQGES